MITRPKVTIDKINYYALNTCYYSSSENQNFGNLSNLKNIDKSNPDFETLALNDFELDGNFNEDFENVSFMSKSVSDANCAFNNVWVQIEFTSPTNLTNVSLEFGDNFPKKIRIEGYSGNTLEVSEIIDEISKNEIYSSISFSNIERVKIVFLESWYPYRYANLQSFLPGSLLTFNSENIHSLSINENTDIISSKLEIDTAHLEVLEKNNEWNVLNRNSIIKNLHKNDRADIEVEIEENGTSNRIFLGRYYISKISTDHDDMLSIDFQSLVGLMDDVFFVHSGIAIDDQEPLENINVKAVIDAIFDTFLRSIGVDKNDYSQYYWVDPSFEQIRTYGYIPIMSCREALQNVCFVNGLMVLDNRDSKIRIKKVDIYTSKDPAEDQIISRDKLLTNHNVELNDKIKTFEVEFDSINLSERYETAIVVRSEGLYTFDSPCSVLRVEVMTPGVNLEYQSNVNYIDIKHVSGPRVFEANVIVHKYNFSSGKIQKDTSNKNGILIKVAKSYMLTSFNVHDFVDFINNYYSLNNLKLKFEYICTTQETGNLVKAIFNDDEFTGFLVHQDVDVSGGMVSRCEMIGYNQQTAP